MNLNEIFDQRDQFYLKAPGSVSMAFLGCIVIGLGLMGLGFATLDGKTVWGAYLFNLFFFFCLGLGGMAMSAIQDVVSAVWARPIKRIWEAFGVFIPVGALMFLLFIIAVKLDIAGAGSVYVWMEDPAMLDHFWGKNSWLKQDFFMARALFILALLSVVSYWQLKQGLNRDMKFMTGDRDGALQEGQAVKERLNFWSGGILIIYGVCLTFFGMDMIMSLSPLWFSTLFGGWQFAIMMQTLFATTLVVMFSLKGTEIGRLFYKQQFHDCGKLMFGFTVFFGYTTFAHVLTYWYGNVPEETEYFLHRLHGPWLPLLWFVFFAAFVFPMYSLIWKASKWTVWVTVPIALIILTAQWTSNLILVMPEVSHHKGFYFPIAELGGFLFFLGLFFTVFLNFGKRFPMVAVADPLLPEGIELSHHHHG